MEIKERWYKVGDKKLSVHYNDKNEIVEIFFPELIENSYMPIKSMMEQVGVKFDDEGNPYLNVDWMIKEFESKKKFKDVEYLKMGKEHVLKTYKYED